MNHPYVGLHGIVKRNPYIGPGAGKNDYTGTVVAIGQGGTTADDGEVAYIAVVVIRDVPTVGIGGGVHSECELPDFIPDDPAEARRRLEAPTAPSVTVNASAVDYEAAGRGFAKEMLRHLTYRGSSAETVYAMLAEAVGRGVVGAFNRGAGGVGEAIGRGIASARARVS